MAGIGRNDPCPCGSGRKFKHCCASGTAAPHRLAVARPAAAGSAAAAGVADPAAQLMLAVRLHDSGAVAEAERIYRAVLLQAPRHPDALHLLGMAQLQQGRVGEAVRLLRQAVQVQPGSAFFHAHLGAALKAAGEFAAALACYDEAVRLRPDFADAHNNRGVLLRDLGRDELAEQAFRRALSLAPQFADAWNNLGQVLRAYGKSRQARECFERAVASDPRHAHAHANVGEALQHDGDAKGAEAAYRRALAIQPHFADALNGLGSLLMGEGRIDEALAQFTDAVSALERSDLPRAQQVAGLLTKARLLSLQERFVEAERACRRALQLDPDLSETHTRLGTILQALGRREEADLHYARALELDPQRSDARSNRASVLTAKGEIDASVAEYQRLIALESTQSVFYSNLLFALNYHPTRPAEQIFEAYLEYDRAFGLPQRATWRPHANSRAPGRKLRIGYVSGDFKVHSVAFFLLPLLQNHDRSRFELTAYSQSPAEDHVTAMYKACFDHWAPTHALDDAAFAERIRTDQIDILVDLAGHTKGNRLPVFARKPAPVSVSWLGYGYTTGLSAIDYFLTDEFTAPPGCEHLFSETPWRLPGTCYAYLPPVNAGAVGPLPALANGHIRFGTLSRAIRLNEPTLQAWAAILQRVPGSRLVIDSRDFLEPVSREPLVARFAALGIERERLEIDYRTPPWDVLRSIDIGLDCFPHNSGTTLFETLYMGIPYVTLAGRPSVGRMGGSILRGVGHPEWIAASAQEYVDIAVRLAADPAALAALRPALHQAMTQGPLMDGAGFARRVEEAYTQMFERWAASHPG
jgi:predicted O-linked N-acetylglucosamine transferase (SPINDLY family)